MRGGQSFADYDVLTSDTTPDPFTITNQTGVPLSTPIESNVITVAGINYPAAISVTGGEYQVNARAWTSATATMHNGASVVVRHTSISSYSSTVSTTLTIGGVSDTFSSTTLAASPTDTTPPIITTTVSGTFGNNGWYVGNVQVSWVVTDPDRQSHLGAHRLRDDQCDLGYGGPHLYLQRHQQRRHEQCDHHDQARYPGTGGDRQHHAGGQRRRMAQGAGHGELQRRGYPVGRGSPATRRWY